MRTSLIALLVIVAALPAQEDKPKKKPKPHTFDQTGTVCMVPASWQLQKNTSRMRLATWRIALKKDHADVVVYWFGKSGAGDLMANLDRWKKQIKTESEPKPTKIAIAKGITAHLIDARGTYVAPVRPGAPERNNQPKSRLLAAVVETPGGPLYVKCVGLEKVLDAHDKAFTTWLKSFKPKPKK